MTTVAAAADEAPVPAEVQSRNAERTRAEILDVAITEFADKGYAGARVDEIGERTRTSKRMIYYYFGSKEGLYVAALEQAYHGIRSVELELDVEAMGAEQAVRTLAAVTVRYHARHPQFIRLVSIENIHRGEHLGRSAELQAENSSALGVVAQILDRGVAAGEFRADVDPLDVHQIISAHAVFPVANRHTFGAIFGVDMLDEDRVAHQEQVLGDLLVGYLRRTDRA